MNDRERRDRFNASFSEHLTAVQRFVERRVDDEQTARDITAEVFTLLWRKDQSANPLGRGWLFKTASNLIGAHYRTTARHRRAMQSLVILATSGPTDVVDEERRALHEALNALRAPQRDVLILTYWDGLSAAEVGVALGMRTDTVWAHLSRGRKNLHKLLTLIEVAEGA